MRSGTTFYNLDGLRTFRFRFRTGLENTTKPTKTKAKPKNV